MKNQTDTNLTTREVAILEAILNYEDRGSQLSDNFSNCDLEDAHRICGGKHEAAGVMGSLVKKGLIYAAFEEDSDLLWLTIDGVNTIFDNIEANGFSHLCKTAYLGK